MLEHSVDKKYMCTWSHSLHGPAFIWNFLALSRHFVLHVQVSVSDTDLRPVRVNLDIDLHSVFLQSVQLHFYN